MVDSCLSSTAIEVRFDRTLYTAEVIERAAYRYIDRWALDLVGQDDGWMCLLRLNREETQAALEEMANEFRKEVLDQKLRAIIQAKTDTVRNLILARAFSRSGLVGDGSETA